MTRRRADSITAFAPWVVIRVTGECEDFGLAGADPLAAAFHDVAVANGVVECTSADAVAGFQDADAETGLAERAGGGEAGQSSADDGDVHFAIGQMRAWRRG
ncbi:MAG: hypothetical protein JWL69_4578 [Phycisphaerales bacterium]|nr:hypothetical protein [Phycisphaerales bacterium]MDB5354690.1 hypothetical protein [Phycisphaerales bacterium]